MTFRSLVSQSHIGLKATEVVVGALVADSSLVVAISEGLLAPPAALSD